MTKTRAVLASLAIALLAAAAIYFSARAQGCTDATGAPIECPTQEPDKRDTPVPPTPEVETADYKWTGQCDGAGPEAQDLVKACVDSFTGNCNKQGGTSTKGPVGEDGGVTITCTIPDGNEAEATPQPLSGEPVGEPVGIKEASCQDPEEPSSEWVFKCIGGFVADCTKAGGDATVSKTDHGGKISCSVDAWAVIEPTPRPLGAAPEDNLIGTCTEAAGDLSACIAKFRCPDGLLVVKVDIYEGVYKFYCIPHDQDPNMVFPIGVPLDPDSDSNWVGGCSGEGIDICLDEMKAACDAEGGEYSEWYDEDGSAGTYCQNESEAGPPAEPSGGLPGSLPNLGLGALIGGGAAIAIPAFMKNARRSKTSEATMNVRRLFDSSAHDHEQTDQGAAGPDQKVKPKGKGAKAKMLSTVSMKIKKPGK